jgi:hypothetical protein
MQIPDTIDALLAMWGMAEPMKQSKQQLTEFEKICQEKQYEASKQKPNKDLDLELAEKTGKYLCPKHNILYSIKETCPKCIALWQTGKVNEKDKNGNPINSDTSIEDVAIDNMIGVQFTCPKCNHTWKTNVSIPINFNDFFTEKCFNCGWKPKRKL